MLYRVIKGTAFTFIGIFLLQFTLPLISTVKFDAEGRELRNQLSKARFDLSITNGLVTLHAENAYLHAILNEIQKKSWTEDRSQKLVAGSIFLTSII